MNTVLATGWLVKEAWETTQPVTYKRILCFDVMLANDGGEPSPWRCEIDELALLQRVAAKLAAGAGVIVQGRLCARPFKEHGVHRGWTRYLHLTHLEFSRTVHPDSASAEPTADRAAQK